MSDVDLPVHLDLVRAVLEDIDSKKTVGPLRNESQCSRACPRFVSPLLDFIAAKRVGIEIPSAVVSLRAPVPTGNRTTSRTSPFLAA